MKKWLACEIHTHTVHSDAEHTLIEMASEAKQLDLDCLVLTDHNTISGHLEIEEVTKSTGLPIIKGLEWTTFYGHMLTLGISSYVDWRNLGLSDLHQGIREVHNQGGIVGIAHPFRVGSPMCTGCYWEYEIDDWRAIDFIEVWSGLLPSIKQTNQRAFDWWKVVLNQGYKVSGTSGRDWHHSKQGSENLAVTYIGVESNTMVRNKETVVSVRQGQEGDRYLKRLGRPSPIMVERGDVLIQEDIEEREDVHAQMGKKNLMGSESFSRRVIDALKAGSASVTLGPLLLFNVVHPHSMQKFEIGETITRDDLKQEEISENMIINLSIDFSTRKTHWTQNLPDQDLDIKLVSNLGILAEATVSDRMPNYSTQLQVENVTWMRAELYGVMSGVRTMIAFTNPIYIEAT